jgi:hypothetical protein
MHHDENLKVKETDPQSRGLLQIELHARTSAATSSVRITRPPHRPFG